MKLALNDDNLELFYRCPDCKEFAPGMTVTHPWRLYCRRCKQELQNPDHPEYYPKIIKRITANNK